MALLDPVDDHHARLNDTRAPYQPTRHPGVCLAGFVCLLLGLFAIVHLGFTTFVH